MQCVYPFILFYEKETDAYAVSFEDLELFTEGKTVEEAYLKAKSFLMAYCKCTAYLDKDLEQASNFVDVKNKYSNELVLLADYENEVKNGQVKSAFVVEVE